MTDLSRLIEDLCAGLDGPKTSEFPVSPEILSGNRISHHIDNTGSFRSFHSFRSEIEGAAKTNELESSNAVAPPSEIAHTSSYVGTPERPETPEREAKTLAGSTHLPFPVEKREPERPETEGQPCERPFLDLNRAGPQWSDRRSSDLMAEVDRASPPPGDPLPISPAEVRAGVVRELRALAEDGRTGPDALRDAIEITAAKIRNSSVLVEVQAANGRCHACGEPLDGAQPEVAVMQGKPGAALHMHGACHALHSRRRAALVDRIMAAAGYGTDQRIGDAA